MTEPIIIKDIDVSECEFLNKSKMTRLDGDKEYVCRVFACKCDPEWFNCHKYGGIKNDR